MKIGNIIKAASKELRSTGNTVAPQNHFEPFVEAEIEQTIQSRFEAVARRHPDKPAVVCGSVSYTYDQLNRKSNRLANAIHEQIKSNEMKSQPLTALLFHHDADLAVGILGALKAGAAYVPLDPTYPQGRLLAILKDAGVDTLVCGSGLSSAARDLVEELDPRTPVIDASNLNPELPEDNPTIDTDPDHWAYILYTSGSTGRPKGVAQNHRNALHHCRVYTNALRIHAKDRISLFSSYGFDAAKMDIYGALLNGATLYPFDIKSNLSQLPQRLAEERITIYHSIPTVYRYFLDQLEKEKGQVRFPHLRFAVLGGEAVLRRDVERYQTLLPDHCLLINGLGPTESTLTLQYFMNKETILWREAAPVGFAVDKTEVLLLDRDNREAPVYGVGEIVYKSDHLALGYLNNPEKTHDAFTVDPLTGDGRVYRSGDLGRRLPDGNIEYAGRGDSQVKVSGYRVELPEIESLLDRCAGVKKSVVVAQPEPSGDNQLLAYYSAPAGEEVTEASLVRQLKKNLPDYMIPRLFFPVEEFPLTGTGKIDRKALANKDTSQLVTQTEFVAPRDGIERTLASIWQEILEIDRVGILHNFFVLGGNSLRAVVLVSDILKQLNVKLPLTDVFRHATLRDMAAAVKNARPATAEDIEPVEERDVYPQSQAQQRIFFLHQMNPNATAYNLFAALAFQQKPDRAKLEHVLNQLIRRHEALRTSFFLLGDTPVQKIHRTVPFTIEILDHGAEDIETILERFVRPFDLAKGPLFRAGLAAMAEGRYLLVYDIHHIIGDGVSISVLIDDFVRLYRGDQLEPLPVQYKDYVLWRPQERGQDGELPGASYWRRIFRPNEALPLLELPTDFPRPAVMGHAGAQCECSLDPQTTAAMRELALQSGASLYMVVLAVYNILLARLSGIDDIIVGTVSSGREHPALQAMMGVFVNLLAMRNQPLPDLTFARFLDNVRQNTLEAFQHSGYPFDKLVEWVGDRRGDRHPVASVGFTFQNFEAREARRPDPALAGMEMVPLKSYRHTALNDINLEVFDRGETLLVMMQYSTALFQRDTIVGFLDYFQTILNTVLPLPEIPIGDIRLMSERERQTLAEDIQAAQQQISMDFDF
jgi:amino acid adenylation domain-containing protein